MSYEIGKFYRVPCLRTKKVLRDGWRPLWGGAWVPVMGPLHRDAGVVNFPWLHWHPDLRFISERIYRQLPMPRVSSPYATPLQKHPTWNREEHLHDTFVEGDVEMRLMKCKRALPEYPRHLAKWLPALEAECAHLKMTNMICPHRGLPLQGCQQDGDVVQCPGHGLRWNVKTGELVRGDQPLPQRSLPQENK